MARPSPSWPLKERLNDVLKKLRAQPFTGLAIAVLVFTPLTALLLSDRTSANDPNQPLRPDPLLQVSEGMRMVQSFRVDASKPVPALWTKLFDQKTAAQLWKQLDEQLWWQAWPQDGDPLLILPETTVVLPSATAPLRRQKEGFTLVFADLLNAVTFDQQPSSSGIVPSPLEAQCFQYLRNGSAVLWTPAALASIAGPLLPLLQSASYGCFRLELKGTLLSWTGVVGSRPLRQASKRLAPPDQPPPAQPADLPSLTSTASKTDRETSSKKTSSSKQTRTPASEAPLLEMSSLSSRSLLGAMLNRPLIRDGLEEDYGLPPTLQLELLDAPLSLKVIQVDQGPFLAGVQLDLQLPAETKGVVTALKSAGERLKERGLQRREKELISPGGKPAGVAVLWFEKEDQKPRLLGGWTLMTADAAKKRAAHLRLTLATPPEAIVATSTTALPKVPVSFSVSMQPEDLQKLGLLGSSWPRPVRRASHLNLILQPLAGSATSHEDWNWMSGQLAVP